MNARTRSTTILLATLAAALLGCEASHDPDSSEASDSTSSADSSSSSDSSSEASEVESSDEIGSETSSGIKFDLGSIPDAPPSWNDSTDSTSESTTDSTSSDTTDTTDTTSGECCCWFLDGFQVCALEFDSCEPPREVLPC